MSAPSVRLTAAQRKALEWFAENSPTCLFGRGDPSLTIVRRLHDAGLLEIQGREAGRGIFGFSYYALSDAGRSALAAKDGEA